MHLIDPEKVILRGVKIVMKYSINYGLPTSIRTTLDIE
jgi:hypothetical protein